MSDVPLKPSFLHRFWSKKCASTFCREISNKNIQFSKWEIWIFNAILDQTKLWRARLWIRIYFNSFLNLLFKVSAIQCNVECRLIAWGRDMQEDVILKEPPTSWVPHPSGEAQVGGANPPRTPLCQIHNGTLKSFVWSSTNWISVFIILKTIYIHLWCFHRKWLAHFYCR